MLQFLSRSLIRFFPINDGRCFNPDSSNSRRVQRHQRGILGRRGARAKFRLISIRSRSNGTCGARFSLIGSGSRRPAVTGTKEKERKKEIESGRTNLHLGVDADDLSGVFHCPLGVGVNAPVKRFALATRSRGERTDRCLPSAERYN